MNWIEAKIITKSEAFEIISATLNNFGVSNIRIIDDEAVKIFLSETRAFDFLGEGVFSSESPQEIIFYIEENSKNLLSEIKNKILALPALVPEIDFGELKLITSERDDEEWLHEWKKTYKTFNIGAIIIRPFWEEYSPKTGETVFVIDPGSVFGTGLHETTRLCVSALEKYKKVFKNGQVLDLGCGSGILGIIAILLGAQNASLRDLDPNCKNAVLKNAELNFLNIDYKTCDVSEPEILENKSYELITANIVADVILEICDFIKDGLAPDGIFIASGIIDERAKDCERRLIKSGLRVIEKREDNGWVAFISERA